MAVMLNPPWQEHYKMISAFFKNDDEVSVIFDSEKKEVKLYVDNATKAQALDIILKNEVKFGNIVLNVIVVPSNTSEVDADVSLMDMNKIIETAFEGNPAVDEIIPVVLFGIQMTYVICKKEVVQYFNDDIGKYGGFKSTLYETIADNIFKLDGIYFSTNINPNKTLGNPLGEWP